MTIKRDLLNTRETASKLKMSKSTFDKHREALEARGFPKPVLEAATFGNNKWDPVAINAWLDLQMSPDLKNSVSITLSPQDPTTRSRLKQSAKELHL